MYIYIYIYIYHFEDLEEVRDKVNATRDKFRAHEERNRFNKMREQELGGILQYVTICHSFA